LTIDASLKSASIVHRRSFSDRRVQQESQFREGFEIDVRLFVKA